MSQENVEAFKSAIDAYNRRDVEAVLAVHDPEVEWHAALQDMLGGEASVYRGHQGLRELVRDLDESFSELQIEITQIRDLGERLVAIGHLRGSGKESGAGVESPIGYVLDLAEGKVTRVRSYLDPQEALEVAGLRGPAMSEEIETLRAFLDAFNTNDFQAAVRHLHPEVEIYPAIGGLMDVSRLYRGRDGARQLLETISEGVENNVDIEDVVEAGQNKVLQVERWHGRGRQGIETPTEIATVYTFRDGLVVHIEGFRDRAKALEAAGLRE